MLDGNNDYVDIDDWGWGGATSFEVYVKYDSFNSYSRVFDFAGDTSDNVYVGNQGTTSTIKWEVYQGVTIKTLSTSNYDSATWTHVVVSIKDTTMKVYKNGVLVGTKTDGLEPSVLTRTNHIIGAAEWSGISCFFDGTIGYLKMWHGVEVRRKLPDLPSYSPLCQTPLTHSPSFFPSPPNLTSRSSPPPTSPPCTLPTTPPTTFGTSAAAPPEPALLTVSLVTWLLRP